jgi:8-oxo-dGTP pyrophosphatase MutT (NUDIX family)
MADASIEVIARGMLIGTRGVLLCRATGADNTFLPGGHIEYGEPAPRALARELEEELGVRIKVEEFLGVVECVFTQDGIQHHEVNLVFQMSSPGVERRARFTPVETNIEYLWQPVNLLAAVNLLPKSLRSLVPLWTRGKQMAWASDIRE